MKHYFQTKFVAPILGYLKQGLSPQKLAITIAVSATVGVIPILGSVTAICLMLSTVFRLNFPVMMIVTTAIYPLQLAAFVPFIQAGVLLFGGNDFSLSLTQIMKMAQNDFLKTIQVMWNSNMLGLLLWAFLAVPVAGLVYFLSYQLLSKVSIESLSS